MASKLGMALRGSQRKVRRPTESSSLKNKTLWETVVEHLDAHGPSLRHEIMLRSAADGEEHIAAVLRELSESGIVYTTGRPLGTICRAAMGSLPSSTRGVETAVACSGKCQPSAESTR